MSITVNLYAAARGLAPKFTQRRGQHLGTAQSRVDLTFT